LVVYYPVAIWSKGRLKGASPLQSLYFPASFERDSLNGCLRGAKPLLHNYFPLMQGIYIHIMERGIKGVR
jgi:hypothetical protein